MTPTTEPVPFAALHSAAGGWVTRHGQYWADGPLFEGLRTIWLTAGGAYVQVLALRQGRSRRNMRRVREEISGAGLSAPYVAVVSVPRMERSLYDRRPRAVCEQCDASDRICGWHTAAQYAAISLDVDAATYADSAMRRVMAECAV